MRIWDVNPGYLARQQLLGEHRELHGLYNILTMGKKGYANHPETVRWVGSVDALIQRHGLLVSEMKLRGYNHHSPLSSLNSELTWPDHYIDAPAGQFELLAVKYAPDGRAGRIPLPGNCQQLWAQHKYSVMAHDPNLYREIGPEVAHGQYRDNMDGLATLLVSILRCCPEPGHLHNALLHMWGYLKGAGEPPDDAATLLVSTQAGAEKQGIAYLLHSTALSELAIWV